VKERLTETVSIQFKNHEQNTPHYEIGGSGVEVAGWRDIIESFATGWKVKGNLKLKFEFWGGIRAQS
jgi:hypothetical protein